MAAPVCVPYSSRWRAWSKRGQTSRLLWWFPRALRDEFWEISAVDCPKDPGNEFGREIIRLKTYIYGIFWGEWTARKTPIQLLLLFLQVMCSWKCFGVLWAPSRGSLRYICNIDPRSPVPSCIIRRHLVNEFLKDSQEKSVFFIDLGLELDSDGYGQRLFSDHYRTATFGKARYI